MLSALLIGVFATIFTPPALALPPRGACEAAFEIPENIRYGQLLIVGFHGTKPTQTSVQRIRNAIRKGEIGGLVFFGKNITSRHQVRRLTHALSSNMSYPPFLAVDEEGGYVQRLTRHNGYAYERSAWWVAQNKTPLAAKTYYHKLASRLADAGFNLNLAPDVDLRINPANPVIGKLKRSYSSDPLIVTAYASAFISAHQHLHIATALKHFPGHGSSHTDSHQHFVDVTQSWRNSELLPFARLINADKADIIMLGHLIHQRFWSSNKTPATFSKVLISELLRGTLGYRGVVITDDLQMRAVSHRYSLSQAVIMALKAGNDMVLIGNSLSAETANPADIVAIIRTAAHDGQLDQRALACSFQRVMRLKHKRLKYPLRGNGL